MDKWKRRGGKSQRGEAKKWEKQRRERVRRKKMQVHDQEGKSRFTLFFKICGSGWSKSRLAKAAGAEPCRQMRDVVARSTSPSQNVQSTPFPDHFSKLSCRKSAHRCGAKHISKSKCTKHARFGPLFEVELSKKCTPLWCEAHFQVKMHKHTTVRPPLESWNVQKVHAVVALITFPSQKCKKWGGSDHFLTFRCRKSVRCSCPSQKCQTL